MRRAPNDLLLELRNRPALTEALVELGVSPEAAAHVVDAYPDGRGLENASVRALEQLGVDPAAARRVSAAFQVVRVCDESCRVRAKDESIRSPYELVELLQRAIGRKDQEYFAVVLVDTKNRILDVLGSAVGGMSQVRVEPREIFQEALRRRAHAVILAHNHPSGDAEPSQADFEITRRLVDAGRLVGIPVLDHLIIAPDEYVSMAALGQIPRETNPTVRSLLAFP